MQDSGAGASARGTPRPSQRPAPARPPPRPRPTLLAFFFSSRRRHTRWTGDWSSDVCSSDLCDAHPDRTVVVYANTSAAVKARADWMVTSSCALAVVNHLKAEGKKILWAPDRHLGRYIQEQTGADMLLWNGACIVHDEFKGLELELLKEQHPKAMILVHPESPKSVVQMADVVGSTSQMLNAVIHGDATEYIVATDNGILHRMRQLAPGKTLIEAPTAGNSATCKSCAHCPWMVMNSLQGLVVCL